MIFVFNAGPSVVAESFEVIKGIHKSGSVLGLAESDNSDLSVTRDSTLVQAIIELSVKGTSPNELPTSFAFSLEASVFARGEITQTIELFNYQTDDFEVVDERPASRFSDQVTIVEPSGDLSRFVQAGTRCIESRITFDSNLHRSQFTANVDHVVWEIE